MVFLHDVVYLLTTQRSLHVGPWQGAVSRPQKMVCGQSWYWCRYRVTLQMDASNVC